MRKIYSNAGEINVDSLCTCYDFYNYTTGMSLRLYKKDIPNFMNIGTSKRFSTSRSFSNYIKESEKIAIKSFLRIKNKRLRSIKSLLSNGENIKDVINIMPIKKILEYIGEDEWKNL